LDKKRKILFIINPISGTRNKDTVAGHIQNNINPNRNSVDIKFTTYKGHASVLAKEAVDNGYDAVVAIGGDGSINEIASVLIHTQTALGIIPNGSGNGLAHYLKIPFNIKKAVEIINGFNLITIDTASINNIPFISVAGIGFDALVAKEFAQSKTRGFFSYLKIIVFNYIVYFRKKYILYINNQKIKRKAMMISLANSNQFGYNSVIAPDARINDGYLNVCIMDKVPVFEAGIISLLLFLKKIDISKRIEILKCKEITVLQNKNRVVHIDGDPTYQGKKLVFKVIPASLKIIAPEKTINQLTENRETPE